jgi:hypothetical protein
VFSISVLKKIPSLSDQTTLIGVKATSHMRLRACDQYTSSTLIGVKAGAGPSSLHTTLKGPTKYVNAIWITTWHRMNHVSWSLELFSENHLLEVGLTQNEETTSLQMLTTIGLFYIIMV